MKLQINGAIFNISDCGEGKPALIFLHYFGGSSRSWSEVIGCLQTPFRCITPDLRGFGDSQATPQGYSIREGANDIAELIEQLKIERYVLIGHSMGGKIALELASRQPRGLQSMVLLAPSPPTPEPMADEERARLQSTFGNVDGARETIGKITARPLPPPLFQRAVEDNLKSSRAAWCAWLEGGSREDIAERINRIQVPVTVLGGDQDKGITLQILQREVVARLNNARLICVPDCGHLLPLEAPHLVADAIGCIALDKSVE